MGSFSTALMLPNDTVSFTSLLGSVFPAFPTLQYRRVGGRDSISTLLFLNHLGRYLTYSRCSININIQTEASTFRAHFFWKATTVDAKMYLIRIHFNLFYFLFNYFLPPFCVCANRFFYEIRTYLQKSELNHPQEGYGFQSIPELLALKCFRERVTHHKEAQLHTFTGGMFCSLQRRMSPPQSPGSPSITQAHRGPREKTLAESADSGSMRTRR